jgi:hypothetical protein
MSDQSFPFGGVIATEWQVLSAALSLCPVSLLLAVLALPVAVAHGVRWRRLVGLREINAAPRRPWDCTWFWPVYVWGLETVRAAVDAFQGDPLGPGGILDLVAFGWQQALGCWAALLAIVPTCMAAEAAAAHWRAPTRVARWTIPAQVLGPLLGAALVWALQLILYTALGTPQNPRP